MANVKRTKVSRADRAAATRRRILDAAFDLFTENGVVTTTMGDVAERAKVAVQTVHFVFHTKTELLHEVIGDIGLRSIVPDLLTELEADGDARSIIAKLVDVSRELFPKVAKLALAVEAAAQGDAIASERREAAKAQRYGFVLQFIDVLQRTGMMKRELTVNDAADIYYALNSTSLYRELIDGRGWTTDRWADWLRSTLCDQLLSG